MSVVSNTAQPKVFFSIQGTIAIDWSKSLPSLNLNEIDDLLVECKYASAALSHELTLLLSPVTEPDRILSQYYDQLKQKAHIIQTNNLGRDVIEALSASSQKDNQVQTAGSGSTERSKATERRKDEYKKFLELVSRVIGPSYSLLLHYTLGMNKVIQVDTIKRAQLMKHLQANSQLLFCPSLLEKESIHIPPHTAVHHVDSSLPNHGLQPRILGRSPASSPNEAGNIEYSGHIFNDMGTEEPFLEAQKDLQMRKRKYTDDSTHTDAITNKAILVSRNSQVEVDETATTGEESHGPQYSLLSQCNITSNLSDNSSTDLQVAQLPSIREMALVGPSLDRAQSQVWNYRQNLTANSGNKGNFIEEQGQRPQHGNDYHLSQRYKAGNSAGNSSLPPSKEHREMKDMYTNAPAENISKMPGPFKTAIENSRLWQWERSQGLKTTGCWPSLFPQDETQDVSFTIWCGNDDGKTLTDFFGGQCEISS